MRFERELGLDFLKYFGVQQLQWVQRDSTYLKFLQKLFAQIFSCELENAVLKPVRFRKHSNVGLYTGDRVLVLLMPLADPPLLVPYQRDAV